MFKFQKIKQPLTTKDLVAIGIFSAILFALSFAVMVLTGISPLIYLFCPAAYALLAGPVSLLLTAKIQKPGVFFLPAVIQGLLWSLLGAQSLLAAFLLFGLLAELVASVAGYKSFAAIRVAYILIMTGFYLGDIGIICIFTDWYVAEATAGAMGANMDYLMTLVHYAKGGLGAVSFLSMLVAAWWGAMLGQRLLRKHFEKAGMV